MTKYGYPYSGYHTEYTRRLERDRAIAERDEARAWAIRYKKLYEKSRKLYYLWVAFSNQNKMRAEKAEREKLLLLEALKGIADSIGGYCDVKECPQCDAYRVAKDLLAKLE